MTKTKPIPISAAKNVAISYGYDQIVIIGRKVGEKGTEHVTTYGVDKENCKVAADIGNFLKYKVMQWEPEPATPFPLVEMALSALKQLVEVSDKAEAFNTEIRSFVRGDFYEYRITEIHPELRNAYVGLIDQILGDEIASYFLYEARNMKDGGSIQIDGYTWPIRTIEDVRSFVFREQASGSV